MVPSVSQRVQCTGIRLRAELIIFILPSLGNDSNLLIVFYVQIMPDDFVMQLHRF